MASWVSEVVSSLMSEADWVTALRERTSSTRIITWVVLNVPPEWVILFSMIGLTWGVCFIAGSAFYTSREVVSFLRDSFRRGVRSRRSREPFVVDESEAIIGRNPTSQRQESIALTGVSLPALGDATEGTQRRRTRNRGTTRVD